MTWAEIFSLATGGIGLLSAVAMGVYAATNNASTVKDSVISAYAQRVGQLEDDMKRISLKLDDMSAKFDRSELARADAENKLNLRNPEFERYMTFSLQLLTEVHAAVLPQTVTPA